MLNWLLVFVPVTFVLEHFAPDRYLWLFASAALAILPPACCARGSSPKSCPSRSATAT